MSAILTRVIAHRRYRPASLLAFVFLLSACAGSTPSLQVATDESADWSRYQTVSLEDLSPLQGPAMETLRQAMQEVLTAKGYQFQAERGDAVMRYQVSTTHQNRVNQEVIPTGGGNVMRTTTENINEAHILANFVDAQNGNVVWKAAADRRLSGSKDPMTLEEMKTRLTEFMESLPDAGSSNP